MKLLLKFLSLITIAVFLISCSSSTESEDTNIRGRVFDQNGDPLSNAQIMLSYNIELDPVRPMWEFKFAVAEQAHVKLWLTKADIEDTLRVLIDNTMQAGFHSICWDGKADGTVVLNDFYEAHLIAGDYETSYYLFFNNHVYNHEESYEYNAATDNEGRFSIPQTDLPYNSDLNGLDYYDEDGYLIGTYSVSRNVNFHALHEDHSVEAILDSVYIDASDPASVELHFTP